MSAEIVMESFIVTSLDGFDLTAHRFSPSGAPRAVVVVPCAMGVRQEFYFPFARFLAQQGFAALTFDYRGAGASVPLRFRRSLRGFKADLFDWAERDYNAALRSARKWHVGVPLLVVGHSLGGQLPGLLPDAHLIDGMLTIASGSGYWRDNAPKTKRMVWFMWYFAVPLYTRLFGYFPGKKVKKVGDLPKGVISQWSQWCRSPHYVVDREGNPIRNGFHGIRAPILSLSFTDDEMMSRRSIDSLNGFYANAPVEHRHIAPEDVQAKRIGHFGFFRPEFRDSLWMQALAWMEDRAQQSGWGRIRSAHVG